MSKRVSGEPHNLRIGAEEWARCVALAGFDQRAIADVIRLLLSHALKNPPERYAQFLRDFDKGQVEAKP